MKCRECDKGMIAFEIPNVITVSRDMAIDAGDLSLEGQSWDWGTEYDFEPCACCGGNWENCEHCSKGEAE